MIVPLRVLPESQQSWIKFQIIFATLAYAASVNNITGFTPNNINISKKNKDDINRNAHDNNSLTKQQNMAATTLLVSLSEQV